MEKEVNVRGVEPVHFDVHPTPPLPIAQQTIPKTPTQPPRDPTNVPQKKAVLLMIIYSIITLGIYPALWYLQKAPEFYNLGTAKKLRRRLPLTLLIFQIATLALLIIFPLTITVDMGAFYQNMTSLQSGILIAIGILYVLTLIFNLLNAFRTRSIMNQALESKGSQKRVNGFFTFIFTNFYLQYEINRILDDKEDDKRIAPWIMLALLVIIITLPLVLPFTIL